MGQSSRKAQGLLLLNHNQIYIWANRFEKDGIDGLEDKPTKLLKPFLQRNSKKREPIFLPAYSPYLNPIEKVWWYMRKKIR